MTFQDQSCVEFIRDALWRHQLIGRATVMVGAGFSFNARPTSPSSRALVDWKGMSLGLCDQLYPQSDATRRTTALETASTPGGFLRLAQEYEAEFGRTALNDRLRDLVPDLDYEPDDLHRRLLALPWADVFTTNWDTLLERACKDVFDRSYDIIHKTSEIPVAGRPRIVKLHGSFPAYEPFIVTEEDYRTYPSKFAAFVNLAQQSMMETVFVLLGFSGDDPNFLHWSGWVRDHLGASAPKIYLVGWLGLSRQRRRMLEDRNVVIVDLALLPIAQHWPDHSRHRYSMEWFITALELGRPPNSSIWPNLSRALLPPSSYLGEIPAPAFILSKAEPSSPAVTPDFRARPIDERIKLLGDTLVAWKWNRKLYPNWLICPGHVRLALWMNTQSWFNELVELAPRLSPIERLFALRELAWRLDTALLPYFDPMETLVVQTLSSIDCQNKSVTLPDGTKQQPLDKDWSDVRKAWCMLAIAIVRAARNKGDRETFTAWLERIAEFSSDWPEVAQHIAYERCQWSRACLDYETLEKDLSGWYPARSDQTWSLRKAGILAEIGRDQDAVLLLKDALAEIRRYRRRDQDDIPALSREGWALWLDLAYRLGFPARAVEFSGTPEPSERWRELAIYRCDARAEYNALLQELEGPADEPSSIVKTRSFELGHHQTSIHVSSGIPVKTRASYQIVKLADVTGLPHSANHVSLLEHGLGRAVHELAEAERWAMSLLAVRMASTSNDKIIRDFFTRSRVALYPIEQVESLKGVLLRQIEYALPRFKTAGPLVRYWIDRLQVAIEVLSRLTLRFSPKEAADTLDLAMRFYRDESFGRTVFLTSALSSLLGRAIQTLPREELTRHLPTLFALPTQIEIPTNQLMMPWPEPVDLLPSDFRPVPQESRDLVWVPIVSRLIQVLESDRPDARRQSLRRLLRLFEWTMLETSEISAFANALWRADHLDEYGFLTDHGLNDWVLLSLPEKQPGQAEEAFRSKYLTTKPNVKLLVLNQRLLMIAAVLDSPQLNRPFALSDSEKSVVIGLVREWMNLSLPNDQLHPLLLQPQLEAESQSLQGLQGLLFHLDVPNDVAEGIWRKVERFEASREFRPLSVSLVPALARIFPDRIEALTGRLLHGLLSENEESASQAVHALYVWIHRAREKAPGLPTAPEELCREVGIAVAARRISILPAALDLSRWLFETDSKEYGPVLAENCRHGLRCLLEEASYTRATATEAEDLNVPLLRQRCIRLALMMANAGYSEDAVVRAWIEAGATDPLPEVRNSLPATK